MSLSNRAPTCVLALAVLLAPGLSPAPAESSTESGGEARQSRVEATGYAKLDEQAVLSDSLAALRTWNAERLLPLLSEENRPASDNKYLDQALAVLSANLGTMTWHGEPVLASAADDSPRSWRIEAQYQRSPAVITLVLNEEQGRHTVQALNIELMKQQIAAL